MSSFSSLETAIRSAIKQNGNQEITGNLLQEILLSVVDVLGNTAINNLETGLSNETTTRSNADTTLQNNITAEATARQNADTTLQNNINSETNARQNADSTLQTNINNEATARQNADTQLNNLITGIKNNIDNGYVYAGIATSSSVPVTGKVFYIAVQAGTYTNFGGQEVTQGINILKYNGSAWSQEQVIGFDDEPTAGSDNPVKSGGLYESYLITKNLECKPSEYVEIQPFETVNGIGVDFVGITTQSRRSVKVYPINSKKQIKYTTDNQNAWSYYAAICIKDNGNYVLISTNDITTLEPNEYFFSMPVVGDLRSYDFKKLAYKPDPTRQLYLLLNYTYNTFTYVSHVFDRYLNYDDKDIISSKDNAIIDNYDYIKNAACKEKNTNLYVGSTAYNGKGVIFNKNGAIEDHNRYDCAVMDIDFGKQYTYINYSLYNGANNFALLVNFGTGYRQMTVSDFVQDSEWMGNDVFFDHSHSYIFKQIVANNGSFWCPKKTDFINEPDGVALVINTRYDSTEVSSSFIINEGDETHTPTIETTIFGYPINGGGATPEETDMIAGKTVIFFGDSITHGNTYGSYVDTVRIKANLGQAINKGVSGYRSYSLVDQITGYGIRGGSVGSPVDFSNIHAATIQIGTNDSTGADYMGDIEKDIPDISIYDISSYPFSYNAPGKTIESATLNNADDFFKLCFPNTYYGNLALIIEYIRWKKPSLRLYMISIPAGMGGRYKVINPAMKALCSKMSIEVIDAIENSGAGQWNITEWSPDAAHLNTVGVELWGSYIARKLQELYYNISF